MTMKKIASIILIIILAFSLFACSNDKAKLVGTWLCGDNIYEFRKDGRYVENYAYDDNPSYYKLLPGKKILIYTEEGEENGMTFNYSFKDGNFYLGEAKYTPYDEKSKTSKMNNAGNE